MGIRGLGGFLKGRIPQRTVQWAAHAGQRWGVDIQCILCRARAAQLSPLTVIAALIVRLRRSHIEPVFIFDGRPPVAKADVVVQRRAVRQAAQQEISTIRTELTASDLTETARAELLTRADALQRRAPQITSSDKEEIKQFLYAAGVLYITPNGEADDVLGFQCREGFFQAVISTDMDMLARGVPLLVVPVTDDATVFTAIQLGEVLSALSLTYDQFVDACMLMGSDYSPRGWRAVDPRSAVEMARAGVDWGAVDVSGEVCDGLEKGRRLLVGADVSWELMVSENQRTKWAAGAPPVELENLTRLCQAQGWPADWLGVLGCC